jgi:RimJ/RimL family protein N-acetyltransferase
VVLETKRLILREWNEDDVDDLVDGLNNIEVSKWLAYTCGEMDQVLQANR